MKSKRILILLSTVFALVAMLISCTANKRPSDIWQTTRAEAIETTMIEVTGDKGETLRVEFYRDTGRCKQTYVNGEPTNCVGVPLSSTYFCIAPDDNHKPNTDMNNDGKLDTYCGQVKFITDGTDIQFVGNSAAPNAKCKTIGGHVYCF
jgi:hypothetical protein